MRIIQVDAFTDKPFAGNPAGVCVLPEPPTETWMRHVAREMNLPETAFLVRRPGERSFDLRWFTPTTEVDLCGHATLASAHVLWQDGHLDAGEPAVFHTRSGLLTATRGADGWITMDFPAEPDVEIDAPEELADALHATPVYVGKNRMDYLVVLEDEAAVRDLQPDLHGLERLGMRGFIVTAPAASGPYDFVSRFFAPRFGIPEDPVTGSAHCCLAPYWHRRLGRAEMTGYQASERGGVVRVRLADERVLLSGQAVTVIVGELVEGGW